MATATKSKEANTADNAARQLAKGANFKRLAGMRVTVALSKIDNVAKLANKNSYSYDDVQVMKIVSALRGRIDTMEKAFSQKGPAAKTGFEL